MRLTDLTYISHIRKSIVSILWSNFEILIVNFKKSYLGNQIKFWKNKSCSVVLSYCAITTKIIRILENMLQIVREMICFNPLPDMPIDRLAFLSFYDDIRNGSLPCVCFLQKLFTPEIVLLLKFQFNSIEVWLWFLNSYQFILFRSQNSGNYN